MILTEKVADIENFEKHVTILTRMFMGSLEENHCITETVCTDFDAQLKSKDTVIQDLQEKLGKIQLLGRENEELNKSLESEIMTLKKEAANLMSQVDGQKSDFETMMKDKNSLNDALSNAWESLKKEVEALQITRKEMETLEDENKNLKEQVNALTRDLEKIV